MVLAYLIRDKGMTYDEAYCAVKARRSIVHVITRRFHLTMASFGS